MEALIDVLFSKYLSQQTITKKEEYRRLSRTALELENHLRRSMSLKQVYIFDKLLENTSQLHLLEVTDAFQNGCRLGAAAFRELSV